MYLPKGAVLPLAYLIIALMGISLVWVASCVLLALLSTMWGLVMSLSSPAEYPRLWQGSLVVFTITSLWPAPTKSRWLPR